MLPIKIKTIDYSKDNVNFLTWEFEFAGSRVGLAGFLQIPGGMVSWTPPRISGGIPGGIGGVLVRIPRGIPGGMSPGMFHNPGRDPTWD